MNKSTILRLDAVHRSFKQGENKLEILRGVTFSLNPGEIVALVGPSGIGKSTLLHIAGLLEKPNKGDVFIGNQSCGALEDSQRTKLRNTTLGFIYQFHHLLPEFTAQENVILPQIIGGKDKNFSLKRAVDLLELVGLSERRMHKPTKLSGGEQQRVAIARALANNPRILLADEPTGNLDKRTADDVFGILLKLVRESGVAALIATHNNSLAKRMDRIVSINNGVLV